MNDPNESWDTRFLAAAAATAILFALGASAVAKRHSLGASGNLYVVKYWIAYIILEIRKRASIRVCDSNRINDASEEPTKLRDRPLELLVGRHASDSAYFCGLDNQGNWFVARLCRREKKECAIWLSLHLAGVGLYECPEHPDTEAKDEGQGSFSAGNLSFELLEDFHRWRISFNGPMRKKSPVMADEQDDSSPAILPHVKFTLIWEALTDPYCADSDISTNFLAAALAGESWSSEYFERLKNRRHTQFEQIGGFIGSVSVDGGDPVRIRLRGFRNRSYGLGEWVSVRRYIRHLVVLESGMFIVFYTADISGCFSRIASGCIFMPNGERKIIDWSDLKLAEVWQDGSPPLQYCFRICSGSMSFKIRIRNRTERVFFYGNARESKCIENIVDVTCDSHRGYGIAEFFYRNLEERFIDHSKNRESSIEAKVNTSTSRSSPEVYAVMLDEEACRDCNLVGGKAAQLGFLTELQKKESFAVPCGICLTKHAFEMHLKENPEINDNLKNLQLAASGQLTGCNLATVCNDVTTKIKATTMNRELQITMTEAITRVFKQDASDKLFAVRSSAVGEDGAELSSAGQMHTFLGVKGDTQSLANAVVGCWASQYTAQAVEYKRQYGQVLSNGMGVVIQEMLPSESSGVLFTRDPISGNPSVMVINANFGLGEGVVSGLSQPDYIRVLRLPSRGLKICEKRIGSKAQQTKIKAGDGAYLVSVAEATSVCCLSDEDILRLCNLGLKVEEEMQGGRDIEWALFNGNIYLLQARPITTNDQPDEFEIMHEFDSPHSREDEFCTSANVGEMMPGAVTPLTITTLMHFGERAMQKQLSQVTSYQMTKSAHVMSKISNGHIFLNLHATEIFNKFRNILLDRRSLELSLLGQIVPSITDEEVLSYNSTVPWYSRLTNAVKMCYMLLTAQGRLEVWNERLKHYFVTKSSDSNEIYADISKRMPDFKEVWYEGIWGSASSGVSFSVLMSILTGGKPCYTMDSYQDVATLLSCCDNVISATVPVLLKEIAALIAHHKDCQEFLNLPLKDATEWILSQRSGNVGTSFKKFLEVHGHRCVREGEMYERSWAQDPSKVVATLQSLAGLPNLQDTASETKLDVEELMKSLKTKLSPIGTITLRRVLPWARRCVGIREWSKCLQVKITDCFKQAYWKLADAMKREGRIPDEDLLFFFTRTEIGTLLKTRSAKLIARAQKRKKLYPLMCKLAFSRDNTGHPIPINVKHPNSGEATMELSGTPVSLGTVRGRACVVFDVKSASALQSGDILIVPFTDIGWSPYFPIVSGLVTEIGGLVSHGAVIAREYGIPCVVNCPRATEIFRTGDLVELCGDRGTIKKLKVTAACTTQTEPEISIGV